MIANETPEIVPDWPYQGAYGFYYDPCYDIICPNLNVRTLSNDWIVDDLNSLIGTISSIYSIDAGSLAKYFKVSKYSLNAKRGFYTFSMDKPKPETRSAKLQESVIKISKSQGKLSVSVRQVSVTGDFNWQPSMISESCFLSVLQDSSYNLFNREALNVIYKFFEQKAASQFEGFKNI